MDVLDSGDGELETIDQGRSGDPSFRAGNRNSISRRRSRTDSVPRKSNCTGCANDSGSLSLLFFSADSDDDFGCPGRHGCLVKLPVATNKELE